MLTREAFFWTSIHTHIHTHTQICTHTPNHFAYLLQYIDSVVLLLAVQRAQLLAGEVLAPDALNTYDRRGGVSE